MRLNEQDSSKSGKSPVTWLSDLQYSKQTNAEKALAWADSQTTARETAPNRGIQIDQYQKVAGLGKNGGYPWCACFVYWCLLMAGFQKKNLPKIGDCAAVRNWIIWARENRRILDSPRRGTLFYWLNRDLTGHIGFCISKPMFGVFRTIEGNTNDTTGTRDGDGVYKRTRTVISLKKYHQYGFIELK